LFLAAVLALFGIVSSGRQARAEDVTTSADFIIADPGLLYVGMAPVRLTLKEKGVEIAPSAVTWSVEVAEEDKNNPPVTLDQATGLLTVKKEGFAQITAAKESGLQASLDVHVWFTADTANNAASYTYDNSAREWKFSTSQKNVALSAPTYVLLDSEGKAVSTLPAGQKPVDAGRYQVRLTVTDSSDSRETLSKEGSVGTFAITQKHIEQLSLVTAAPFTEMDASASKDVTVEKDNLLLSIDDTLLGADKDKKEARAAGTFTYPAASVRSAGERSDGKAVLKELQASSDLKNYCFRESYSLENVSYKVVDAPALKVTAQPKLTYTEKETLDLSGLVVTFSENGEDKEYRFGDEEFGSKFSVSPDHGTVLTLSDANREIQITHKVSEAKAYTDVLKVSAVKALPSLTIEAPASGPAGGSIPVTVKFGRGDSDKPYPDANLFTLSDNQSSPQSAAFKAGADGVYTTTYNLPNREAQVVLTVSFKGDGNFEGVSVSSDTIKASIENPVPVMTLSADKTSLPGGGTVTLTLKMTAPEGAPVLPGAGEINLSNDRGWTGRFTGSGGFYTATCTLPNQVDVVKFTASFGGNKGFSKAEDAVCTVKTTYAASEKGSELEAAIARLPSASDVKLQQMDASQKALVEQQLRALIQNISQLSDGQKRYIKTGSLEHMDDLLAAVTTAQVADATISSYYSDGSSSRVQEGAVIKGALASANAGNGDKVSLRIDQSRNGSSRTFLQVDLSLRKRGKEVELLTPVEVSIPLPENYIKRGGVSLRHKKSTGGYEYPAFTITGERGSYVLTFRANSFSAYTLYLPTGDSGKSAAAESYYIKAKAGSGGTISPTGNVEVEEGKNQTFTIKPKAGYVVDRVLVDGDKYVALKEDNTYTFKEVGQSYTIEVVFKPVTPASAPAPVSSVPASQSQKPAPGGSASAPASSAPTSSSPSEAASSEAVPEEPAEDPPEPLPFSEPEVSPTSEAAIAPDILEEDTENGLSSKKDLAVAVVIVMIVVALSMAAVFFGVYLSRRRDEEYAGEDDEDDEDYEDYVE